MFLDKNGKKFHSQNSYDLIWGVFVLEARDATSTTFLQYFHNKS